MNIFKQKFSFWLCLIFAFPFFVACCDDDKPTPDPNLLGEKRTVLIYMVADKNGLEENYGNQNFASRDIEEMLEGMKQVDTSLHNLLVYIDDNNAPSLFRITKDAKGNTKKEVLKEYNEQISTDAAVMIDVLKTAFALYPADSYGLLYWSHADGWVPHPLSSSSFVSKPFSIAESSSSLQTLSPESRIRRSIGQDKGDGVDRRMNLSEFVSVLSATGIPHFEFIMFDACYMLSVELVYELRNFADYYIGSPTEIPGPGAPYHAMVPLMFKKKAAVNMASAYFDYYESLYNGGNGISNSNWTGGSSIAVLDMKQLDRLAEVTKQVLSTLTDPVDVNALRNEVFNYDKRKEYYSSSHIGYYDMVEMMSSILQGAAYVTWKETFDNTLLFWKTTDQNYSMYVPGMFSMKGTSGLTHYIPDNLLVTKAYRTTEWYKTVGWERLGW